MNDIIKQKQLKRHQLLATGLLLLMVIIYIVMMLLLKNSPQIWMGYVKAFSEAGMVGALADWFAVTALFRHPMGLKIPHTNLIENKKNALGKNLGDFVSTNFLTSDTIRPYIDKLSLSEYIYDWLSLTKNKELIVNESQKLIHQIIEKLDDKTIISYISKKGIELAEDLKLEQIASIALHYLLEQKEHQRLLDIFLPQAQIYVKQNKVQIYNRVVEKQPILGLIGGKAVTEQLISGIVNFLEEIQNNENHEIRRELTQKLYEVAHELNHNEEWNLRFKKIKKEFISEERIYNFTSDIWRRLKIEILEKLNDKEGKLVHYLNLNITNLIAHFKQNSELQKNIDLYVRLYVYKIILRNSNEVGKIISNTVNKWDGAEMSRKLELEVGKDLQYIRINGTLVGGIVGLIIHTFTELFL